MRRESIIEAEVERSPGNRPYEGDVETAVDAPQPLKRRINNKSTARAPNMLISCVKLNVHFVERYLSRFRYFL